MRARLGKHNTKNTDEGGVVRFPRNVLNQPCPSKWYAITTKGHVAIDKRYARLFPQSGKFPEKFSPGKKVGFQNFQKKSSCSFSFFEKIVKWATEESSLSGFAIQLFYFASFQFCG